MYNCEKRENRREHPERDLRLNSPNLTRKANLKSVCAGERTKDDRIAPKATI